MLLAKKIPPISMIAQKKKEKKVINLCFRIINKEVGTCKKVNAPLRKTHAALVTQL